MEDNNELNLRYSTDLDWAQITYALNEKRLLFITSHKYWLDFHNENLENSIKYNDITAEELCERFLEHILPNIYDYELTSKEEHLLNLLDLHPNFERTEQGFILVDKNDLEFPRDMATIQPLMACESLKEMGFNAEDVHLNKQIVIKDITEQITPLNLDVENAALLSIVFSTDDDLLTFEMLTVDHIHKCFKVAKNKFELKGQLPINANISVDDLLKKLTTICEIKTAITKLLENIP